MITTLFVSKAPLNIINQTTFWDISNQCKISFLSPSQQCHSNEENQPNLITSWLYTFLLNVEWMIFPGLAECSVLVSALMLL